MRPELNYGLLAGAAMSGWVLIEYALGLHTRHFGLAQSTGWVTVLILLTILHVFLRRQITRLNRYWLPVWEGVLHGTFMSLVAALVFYVFLALYLFIIHPAWPDHYLEWQVARYREAGLPEKQIGEFARFFRWTVSPAGLAAVTLGLYTVGGLLASSVLTLWVNWRHKEKPVGPD